MTDEMKLLKEMQAVQVVMLAQIIELRELHEKAHGSKFTADHTEDALAMIASRRENVKKRLL